MLPFFTLSKKEDIVINKTKLANAFYIFCILIFLFTIVFLVAGCGGGGNLEDTAQQAEENHQVLGENADDLMDEGGVLCDEGDFLADYSICQQGGEEDE